MESLSVVYMREEDGRWAASVTSLTLTLRGWSIEETRGRLRRELSRLPGWTEERARQVILTEERVLPPEAKAAVEAARKAGVALLAANQAMDAAVRRAIEILVGKLTMSYRDVGRLLGLSHGRIYQITKGTRAVRLRDRRIAAARVAARKLRRPPRS